MFGLCSRFAGTKSHRTLLMAAASAVALSWVGSGPAFATCDAWNGGNGDWFGSGGWDGGDPNSSGTDVCITAANSTVDLNGTAQIADLTIGSTDELDIPGRLEVFGSSINNAGLIDVQNGYFDIDATVVTLTGGGIVGLTSDPYVEEGSGSLTLDNVNNLIEGTGDLGHNGLSLDNQAGGTVDALNGILNLNGGGPITNAGILEATNGGVLDVSNSVTNSGNITADGTGSTVNFLNGITIAGGTLNTLSNGVLYGVNVTLNGVTLSTGSTFTVDGHTNLEGTIVNKGTFANPNNYLTIVGGDVTLTGGGTVQMSGDAWFNEASTGLTLDNVDNLIEGSGELGQNGLALDNEAAGIVDANLGGVALNLNGGGLITNAGLLEATNSGILVIDNNVTNSGNITADGGTVDLQDSATITGGTLNVLDSGVMNSGTATLDGVTLSTGSTLTDTGTTLLEGTFTNQGTVLNANNNLTVFGGNLTLTGGGIVQMSSDAWFNEATTGLTLDNVDNLIEGTGQLGQNGLALLNEADGIVDANVGGGTLSLNGGGLITNNGLLEATNGGILTIDNDVTNNSNITADGGTVNLTNGMTVTGGTLNTLDGGVMNSGTATLSGVTLSTGSTLTDTGVTYLEGTFTNSGTVLSANNNLTVLGGNLTLNGGGTIQMSEDAFFNQATTGLTLDNVNNLIEGTGALGENGLALDNEAGGVVDANVGGGTLFLNGGGTITNAGLLEATGGGILTIDNDVTNSGANITADGGTVNLTNNMTLTGGTLNTLDAGVMNSGTATLSGVTLSTGSTLTDTGTTFLEGTFTNNGTVLVPNNNLTILGGNVTLNGGGTIQMSSDAFFNQASGGLALFNVDNTIEGTGQIGQNGMSLENETAGTILANINGGTLNLNGGGFVDNQGTFQVDSGAELLVNVGTFDNYSGGILEGGTYNVIAGGGSAIMQIDNLGVGGGEIVENGATIYLSGANSFLWDLTGDDALSNLAINDSNGTFHIDDGRNFTTQNAYNNAGNTIVGAGSNMYIGNATRAVYDQTGNASANTQIDGTLNAYDVDVQSGTLEGTGSVNVVDQLFNYGTVQPGDLHNVGTLSVNGNYVQGNGGTLLMNLAGLSFGQYSHLDTSAITTLYDGVGTSTLAIDLLGSFHLVSGDKFELIDTTGDFINDFTNFSYDGHSCSGADSHLTCGGLSGLYLSAAFCDASGTNCSLNPTGLDYYWLEVFPQQRQGVPEPGTLVLLGSGLGALSWLRRRRRKA